MMATFLLLKTAIRCQHGYPEKDILLHEPALLKSSQNIRQVTRQTFRRIRQTDQILRPDKPT